MTWIIAALRTKLGQAVALALAVLAALGIARSRWRSQGRTEARRKQKERELEAHDRINDADTGNNLTDDERIERLRRLDGDWRSD